MKTHSHEGPKCPHCQTQITADGPAFYDEMAYTQDDCDHCGKPFKVEVFIQTTWTCWAEEDEG